MSRPRCCYRFLSLSVASLLLADTSVHAAPPGWWATRAVSDSNKAPQDFAAANAGQLKNMAVAAYEEFLAKIPSGLDGIGSLTPPNSGVPTDKGGTGWRLQRLVQTWVKLDSGAVMRSSGQIVKQDDPLLMGPAAQDFTVIRQGQLKNVAEPFYDRLIELYRKPDGQYFASGPYPKPWTGVGTMNHAAANLGQLKAVFSFNLDADRDGDGETDFAELLWNAQNPLSTSLKNPFSVSLADNDSLDDAWEMLHFGDLANGPAGDYDLDGITNGDEFAQQTNPATFHDPDSDGLSSREESLLGTNPLVPADPSAQTVVNLVIYIP